MKQSKRYINTLITAKNQAIKRAIKELRQLTKELSVLRQQKYEK